MRTWRFPRFSALLMLLRASARTFMRTMVPAGNRRGSYVHYMYTSFSAEKYCAVPLRLILDLVRLTESYIKP